MPRIDILMTSSFGNLLSNDVTQSSKRFKTKRGLASELEQENASSSSFNTPIKIPHLFPSSPINRSNSIQSPLSQIPAPLLPRSPIKNCLSFLPSDISQMRRSALGDITPGGNELSPSKLTLSPNRRFPTKRTPPASPIKTLNLKKRWLKEVVQEQKRQTEDEPVSQQPAKEEEPDSENLALPIRWNDADTDATGYATTDATTYARFRRSPLAWSAVSALVEMAEQSNLNNQPLNLSKSRGNKC